MKPPPFEYDSPKDVGETLALLDEHGAEAKVLAGGQSLIPLLNFRLARPARLVDVNGLGELARINRRDGRLHVGALVRQSALERSQIVATGWPMLRQAVRHVAHAQIRNRGTIGGSVAHADPAAELPVAFAALDAIAHVRSLRGCRTIEWSDLFVSQLTTSLAPDELLVAIEVPAPPSRTGSAFVEFARRHGDFALGGAAVVIATDAGGRCSSAAIAPLCAGPTPDRIEAAEAVLLGRVVDHEAAREAASIVAGAIEPTGDLHGDADYRRRLIGRLVERALTEAARAAERAPDVDGLGAGAEGG